MAETSSTASVLSKSTQMKLLVGNRRNLSVRAERKPGGLALLLGFQSGPGLLFRRHVGAEPCLYQGSRSPSVWFSPAGLQMRAVCAVQLHKRSTLLYFNAD